MRQIAKIFVVVFLITFLILSNSPAKEMDVMYDFYNGFAEVIESNSNDPDNCVKQSEVYIKNKAASLMESARQAQAAAGQSSVTEEQAAEWSREQPLKPQRKDLEAVNRFGVAFQAFQQRYPEHAARIRQMMDKQVQ